MKQIRTLFVILGSASLLFGASLAPLTRLRVNNSIQHQESKPWPFLFPDAHAASLTSAAPRVTCENTAVPEALATPQPLLTDGRPNPQIVVNFIIGIDGHVHNPLILRGGDDTRDSTVLSAIRSWKFRPATCNGIPAEAEGTVEFSRR